MLSRRVALAFVAVVLGLVYGVSSASAAKTRVLETSFGPDGTAATAFKRPAAIGVDQSTGQIYVEDTQTNTVQRFDSSHEPEPFTGLAPNIKGGVLTGFSFSTRYPLNQLAVNSTSHDFYVVNNRNGGPPKSLQAFQSDGERAEFTAGPGKGTNEIGGFAELCGVAVDFNGDIYASDYFEGVQVFAPSGEHITTIANTVGATFCNAAVDSHGTLYLNHFEGKVEKLTPSAFPVTPATTYTAPVSVDENNGWGVAVDPATEHLLVDEHTAVAEYDETGARLFSFGALTASEGVAVNGVSGHVYVSDGEGERRIGVFSPVGIFPEVVTGSATEVKATSATLNGTVNPEGVEVTDCHFDYGTTTAYGQTAECEPKAVGNGTGTVAVTAKLKGLTPGTTYHFRLQASNVNGRNFATGAEFSTTPPPSISGAVATNLTASSVDLNARVNPNGLPVESCEFEYGTEAGVYPEKRECTPAPALIGEGSQPVAVSQHVEDLKANVTYHWRVAASNEGTTTSADHTFVYPTTGETLPDNRAYEMVTPVQKNGGLIGDIFKGFLPDVSEAGSRVIAMAIQCFEPSESCNAARDFNGEPFAFSRTLTGWKTTALAPPANQFSENTPWLRSADQGTAVFSMPTGPAGEDEWYARLPEGTFIPFGPAAPPGRIGVETFGEAARATTSDLSHLVWESKGASWPFDRGSHLYEYVGANNKTPLLVGVSGGYENGENHNVVSSCGASMPFPYQENLSADGRTVYFTVNVANREESCFGSGANKDKPAPHSELFARVDGELAGAHTVAISQPRALSPGAPDTGCTTVECLQNIESPPAPAVNPNWREAIFAGASSDGSKAFFLDPQQLLDSATEGARGGICPVAECNLYLYDFAQPEGQRLIDVSRPEAGAENPRVQGVVHVSADGSHVYFVALGKLASNRNALSSEAVAGQDNLYVFDSATGHVAFIATLPASDERNWRETYANVTADGRFLVFESHGALTADARAGGAQIFRYDADTRQLVRISIGNDGFNDNGNAGTGDAAIVPPTQNSTVGPNRRDPTMSNDGSRVFFMSPVALTPHALNDVVIGHFGGETEYAQNVYEYYEGHVYLISDGHDTSDANTAPCKGAGKGSGVCLLGSDASGSNVFFMTASRLVRNDTDTQVDIYDARMCEPERGNPCVTEPPPPLPPCGGEACHGIPATTPSGLTPGTATFKGEGNVTSSPAAHVGPKALTNAQKLAKALSSCRKKYKNQKRRRATCERQAHKAYGATAKKAKRPINHRRAGR